MSAPRGISKHRASYTLERGTWRAVCQECGWQTGDAQRRQAASLFRMHIQESRHETVDPDIIDLTDEVRAPSGEGLHIAG